MSRRNACECVDKRHEAAAVEPAAGVAFQYAVAGNGCHIVVRPVSFWRIRENFRFINIKSLARNAVDHGLQLGHLGPQLYDFLRHGLFGTGLVAMLAKTDAHPGIDHFFPVANGAANTEQRVVIRLVKGADGRRRGILVMPDPCTETELVIGIKIQGMQRCQASSIIRLYPDFLREIHL